MTDLKPCPFCGGNAELKGGPYAQESFSVWCENGHNQSYGYKADEAITAWNTRAPISVSDAAKMLEQCIAHLNGLAGDRSDPWSVCIRDAAIRLHALAPISVSDASKG